MIACAKGVGDAIARMKKYSMTKWDVFGQCEGGHAGGRRKEIIMKVLA